MSSVSEAKAQATSKGSQVSLVELLNVKCDEPNGFGATGLILYNAFYFIS